MNLFQTHQVIMSYGNFSKDSGSIFLKIVLIKYMVEMSFLEVEGYKPYIGKSECGLNHMKIEASKYYPVYFLRKYIKRENLRGVLN